MIRPGPLSHTGAEELNALAARVIALEQRLAVVQPLADLSRRQQVLPFLVQITGGANPYAYQELVEDTGEFPYLDEGRAGDLLYDANGATDVAIGQRVVAFPGDPAGPEYWFTSAVVAGTGAPLTVGIKDAESFANVTLLEMERYLFGLAQESPGQVTVTVHDFTPAPDPFHGLVPAPTMEGPHDPPWALLETGDWGPPGGFVLTVESDGTSLSDLDTILFHEADAFRIEDEGPGSTRVRFDVFKPYEAGGAGGKQGAVPAPGEPASDPPRVLAETGEWVPPGAAPPPYSLTVGSDDVSCPDVTDIVFTTADAFVVECGAQARVKLLDFTATRHGLVPQPPSTLPATPPLVLTEVGWGPGGAFNLTVSETQDPGESFGNITTIFFDSDDGFTLEQNNPNTVRVRLTAQGYTGSVYHYRPECEDNVLKVYRTILTYVNGLLNDVGEEEFAYSAGCCACPDEVETDCGAAKTELDALVYLDGGLQVASGTIAYNWSTKKWEGDLSFPTGADPIHVTLRCDGTIWKAALAGCATAPEIVPQNNQYPDQLEFDWGNITSTCYGGEPQAGSQFVLLVNNML